MSVTSVVKDREAKTMTLTAEFDAPVERIWELWADPRQLERWWGPPTYPATFEEHNLTPGGAVTYFMTGPEGDTPRGWWTVISVDAPHSLEFEDGFADDAGNPNPDMPVMTMRVAIDGQPSGRTRMIIQTTFPSPEAMDQLTAMGMEEGMTAALSQIDQLLHAEVRPR
jgi:uncharacterized protein YndB with AHSA1/START domain